MANLLKMAISETICALHRRGWSQRRIAAELGIVRETVAPENDMAEMRVQGARKKRWHGI